MLLYLVTHFETVALCSTSVRSRNLQLIQGTRVAYLNETLIASVVSLNETPRLRRPPSQTQRVAPEDPR